MPNCHLDLHVFQGEFLPLPDTLTCGFPPLSPTDRDFVGTVRTPKGITVAAFHGTAIVGFARIAHVRDIVWESKSQFPLAIRENKHAYVDVGVAVAPDYQRKGLAERMIQMLVCFVGPDSLIVLRVQTSDRTKLRRVISNGFDRTWICTPIGLEMRCADVIEVESYPQGADEETGRAMYILGCYTSSHRHNSSCHALLPPIPEEDSDV